jgi:uncharacterized protein (TIGR02147 family)
MSTIATEAMNIFDYGNARAYMKDKWQAMKAQNAKYSARFISKELGFGNPVYFLRIVNGERTLSDTIIDPLIRIFKLSPEEGVYFRYLCFYTEESDPLRREDLLDKLISLNHTSKRHLLQSEFKFHQDWHHNTVWALLDVLECDGSDEACQKLGSKIFPRVAATKIRSSIGLLQDLNFIQKDEKGNWRPKGKTLFANAKLHDEIVMQYWLKMLSLAGQTILGKPKVSPRIYTNTFSCSDKALTKINKKLDSVCAEIRAIITKDEESKRVIHFQFQMFDQYQN